MARAENHHVLLKRLKKQVTALRRREENARNKLRAALHKVRGLSLAYKRKLAARAKVTKNKVVAAQAATYKRMAADIEKQLEKKVVAKGKALASAIVRVERLFANKLTKAMHSKAKKVASRGSAKARTMVKSVTPRRSSHVKLSSTHRRRKPR